MRIVCTAKGLKGKAHEIEMDVEMFREPLSKKCSQRLRRGPPCVGDGSDIASYLHCFAWHKIQHGDYKDYTTREVLLDGLSEAGRKYHKTCKINYGVTRSRRY